MQGVFLAHVLVFVGLTCSLGRTLLSYLLCVRVLRQSNTVLMPACGWSLTGATNPPRVAQRTATRRGRYGKTVQAKMSLLAVIQMRVRLATGGGPLISLS